jgi:hypothetical protein
LVHLNSDWLGACLTNITNRIVSRDIWNDRDHENMTSSIKYLLTSLTAVESATHVNVMSHACTTSAGLFPLNAPDDKNSFHWKQKKMTIIYYSICNIC